jgi:hypothetical protein
MIDSVCVGYLSIKTISKEKKFELQNCRSRRKLHFSYKVYLHEFTTKKSSALCRCLNQYKRPLQYPRWVGALYRCLTSDSSLVTAVSNGGIDIVLQNIRRMYIFVIYK